MKIILQFLFIIIAVTIYSCANVVNPTGGPKDLTPPVVLKYTPDTNSIQFKSQEIQIQFDEYIILNDVFNQVVISPPLDGVPTYKIKGKILSVKLNSILKDSTTYTINFGEAIKDNTEGNILNNFTYVFSTGNYLDSLQVSGKVTDILTGAPSEKSYVLLYYEPTDTSFTTTKPYYFTKTDKSGNFIIKNIRPGKYNLYALEDQNFNYYYDLPNERIGFQSQPLFVDTNITGQKLQIFSENKIKQNLLEIKSPRYGQTRLVFAHSADDVQIEFTGIDSNKVFFTRNITNDTVILWNRNYLLDVYPIRIKYDTTIIEREIEVKPIPTDSNFYITKNIFTSNVIVIKKGGDKNQRADWDLNKKIELTFYNPIDTDINILPITISDSLNQFPVLLQIDSNDSRKVFIEYNWKPETKYDIIFQQGQLKDIFGLSNSSDTIKILTRKTDAYSSLTTSIINKSGYNIIFQLLKFDLTLVEEKYLSIENFSTPDNRYTVKINFLLPGVYKLRAIIDVDKNGKWTPGDIKNNILPETVIIFPVDQNLRANWENEIDWEIK